jgi:hypothetical protein
MYGLDNLDTLFVVSAYLFQLILAVLLIISTYLNLTSHQISKLVPKES